MTYTDLIVIIVLLSLMVTYTKHALHIFQQNRYEFERYTKWLLNLKNYQLNDYFVFVAVLFIVDYLSGRYIQKYQTIAILGAVILFTVNNLYLESKKSYIKPLVYTPRVKRQIACTVVIDILMVMALYKVLKLDIFVIATVLPLFVWLVIYLMAIIMLPIEKAINKRFENEGRAILDSMNNLKKIGITGSFGKTSVKNIVENIISDHFYTLMTPASYNTPMGITRTIREMMKPIHEVFVCEMGADHVGDIEYLMDYVKPQIGIVTSIGPQHLNTFHSLENIINEKMKMIEMLDEKGFGVINLDNEYIAQYKIKNPVRVVSVGIKNHDADYVAYDIDYDENGSSFKVMIDGEEYVFETVLLGEHNIMNVLIGIATAFNMGVKPADIQSSVARIKRIEHRLELKKINGYTFIDNAFNSNPVGCKLSLDVLKKMHGRRVIVTPGLIDLGEKEYEYNYDFGLYMKDRVDYVLLVGKVQTKPIYDGLMKSGFDSNNIIVFDSVKEAFDYIYQHFTHEDTILLENDLPDAFSH